jgi:hypothetical protein
LIRIRLKGWGAGQVVRRIQELKNPLPESKEARKLTPEQIGEIIRTYSFDNVSSMIRRSAWEQVNFPRRRFAEDIGWAKQVLDRGWKIVYEPESMVIHSHNQPLLYEFKRIYLDHQNWWQVGKFRIFNRRREVIGASVGGSWRMIRALWKEEANRRQECLRPFSLIYWSLYAPVYIFSQNLAQYMGSWADRWKEKYPWYDKIDRAMSKGV